MVGSRPRGLVVVASLALASLSSAVSAQPSTTQGSTPPSQGTAVRRNTNWVTTVHVPGSGPPPPERAPENVGSTGVVNTERGPTTALRTSATPGETNPATPITEADVARLVRAEEARLRTCYERARTTRPTLAGRVQLSFTIGADGAVTRSVATGLPEAPEVATCLADQVRQTRFPRPARGTLSFMYPMTFSPPAPARGTRRGRAPATPTTRAPQR